VTAETNYQALKLWFFTRKGVPSHEEPNLEGFSFPVTVPFHDSSEPAWAAGRRNTGRGFTYLRTTLPVDEG